MVYLFVSLFASMGCALAGGTRRSRLSAGGHEGLRRRAQMYWEKSTNNRLTRRRAIAGMSLAAATGALYLSGCGGGKSTSGGQKTGSKVYEPVDSTARAKYGGGMKESGDGLMVPLDLAVARSGTDRGAARLARPGP